MTEMIVGDEIARRNLELAQQAVCRDEWGKPWLDLDVEGYRQYRAGQRSVPPGQERDEATAMMMKDVEGKEVLILAGGGGQSANTRWPVSLQLSLQPPVYG